MAYPTNRSGGVVAPSDGVHQPNAGIPAVHHSPSPRPGAPAPRHNRGAAGGPTVRKSRSQRTVTKGKGKGKPKGKKPSRYHYGLRAGYTKADLNTPGALVNSPTLGQAIAAANAQAGAQFNPTINSLNTRLGGLPSWFNQYRQQVQAAQGMSNAVAQPQIQQAQQFAQNTSQPLGLQGPAGQQDQLAAAGRAALTMLGAQALQGIQQANNNYFSAQQAQIAPQQFQATTDLNTQLGQARQGRAAAAQQALGTIRTQAQNNQIANATLGLNTAKAQLAEQDKAASRRVTVRGQNLSAAARRRQQGLAKRGQDLTHQDRVASQQAAQAKRQAAQQQKTVAAKRKFQHKVNDAADRWQTLSKLPKRLYNDPNNPNKVTGTRKPTPDEIRAVMQKEGYTSAQINAALRQLRRRRRQAENKSTGLSTQISHKLSPAPGGARPT
jgi:hypothetical protein